MRVAVVGDSIAEKLASVLRDRGYTPVVLGPRVSRVPPWAKVLFVKTQVPITDRTARAWGGESRSHCLIYYKSVGEAVEGLSAVTDAPLSVDYPEELYRNLSSGVRKKGSYPYLMENVRIAARDFALIPRRLKEQAIRDAQKAVHLSDLRNSFAGELLSQYKSRPVIFGAVWCMLQGGHNPRTQTAERLYFEIYGKKTNYGTMRLSMVPVLHAKEQAAALTSEPAPEPDEAVPASEESPPPATEKSPAAQSFQDSRLQKLEAALGEADARAQKHGEQLDSLRAMNTSLMDQIARAHNLMDQALESQEQLRQQNVALRRAVTTKVDELEQFVRKQARATALVTNSNIKMVEQRLSGMIDASQSGDPKELWAAFERLKLLVEEQVTVPAPYADAGKVSDQMAFLLRDLEDLRCSVERLQNTAVDQGEMSRIVNAVEDRSTAFPPPLSLGSAIDRVLGAGAELKFPNLLKG